MPDPGNLPVALREERERTIRVLCDHFALDNLEVAEFERRLDQANRARSLPDLHTLTADLPVPGPAQPSLAAPARGSAPASRSASPPPASFGQRARQVIVGLMGGATRRGRWIPAQDNTAVAIMGGVVLDFREAQLPAGETVVHAFALMGGVEIFVPPGLAVTIDGIGIMGGFDHRADTGGSGDPNAPRLRIDGVALMGGVEVRVREPGAADSSSDWSSVQGRRQELRARRHALREEARRLRDEFRGRR